MTDAASPYGYVMTLLDGFDHLPSTIKRPPTFLEVAGYPHYENVHSNILAFYLDPENSHGMGSLLLDALARGLGVEPEGEGMGGNVSVEREVVTDSGNRIDILIESDTSVIVIENKVFAPAGNPFADYSGFLDRLASNDRRKYNSFSPFIQLVKAAIGVSVTSRMRS